MMTHAPHAHRESSRLAIATLATGSYLLLAALLFYAPFLLSPYAEQNDVFMSNLFAAPLLFILGVPFLISGLLGAHGQRRTWERALLLAIAAAGILSLTYILFGSRYYAFGETVSSVPPYLDGWLFALSLALGTATFILGWLWNRR